MTMEHRWGRRIPVDLGVSLHYRPLGRVRGRLRNLSSSGAFVHTPHALPQNARVELVFTSGGDGAAQIHRLEGVVVRAVAGGIGVMFFQFHRQDFETLLARWHSGLTRLTHDNTPTTATPADGPGASNHTKEA